MIKKGKKRITITLDEDLLNEIENKSNEYKTTKSDLIELWLDWYLFLFFENWKTIREENQLLQSWEEGCNDK